METRMTFLTDLVSFSISDKITNTWYFEFNQYFQYHCVKNALKDEFAQGNTEILNSFSEDSLLALQCMSLYQKSMTKPLSQVFFALQDSHIQNPT